MNKINRFDPASKPCPSCGYRFSFDIEDVEESNTGEYVTFLDFRMVLRRLLSNLCDAEAHISNDDVEAIEPIRAAIELVHTQLGTKTRVVQAGTTQAEPEMLAAEGTYGRIFDKNKQQEIEGLRSDVWQTIPDADGNGGLKWRQMATDLDMQIEELKAKNAKLKNENRNLSDEYKEQTIVNDGLIAQRIGLGARNAGLTERVERLEELLREAASRLWGHYRSKKIDPASLRGRIEKQLSNSER